jgi:hypothetical protein
MHPIDEARSRLLIGLARTERERQAHIPDDRASRANA